MTTDKQTFHVITILWGSKYTAQDVNRLFKMVTQNTRHSIQFHLFSDESLPDLDPTIRLHPEPGLQTTVEHRQYNYRKEAGLCAPNLGGLQGERVFFFDLDVLIMSSLDALFEFPQEDKFYSINDWNTRGNHVGQASCYSFVVGTLDSVKTNFEADSASIIQQFGTASQEYLSSQVIEKQGKLEFWPAAWCQSFKYHCLPWGFLRHFLTPKLPPKGTKVLAFHGHPDIEDALIGRWSAPDAKKAAKGWKHLYKACRPTNWIREYWCD
jgi:hypothetical protein